jgi:hypothetical protein
LAARIGRSHRMASGAVVVAGIWTLSFLFPMLPSDTHVSVFRSK